MLHIHKWGKWKILEENIKGDRITCKQRRNCERCNKAQYSFNTFTTKD